jgi:hypothetical protein
MTDIPVKPTLGRWFLLLDADELLPESCMKINEKLR